MKLRGNYYKSADSYNDKFLTLRLNFLDVADDDIILIEGDILSEVQTELISENCYFVSFDSKGRMKFPKRIVAPILKSNPDVYSIGGMILPDKKLIKIIMDKPFFVNESDDQGEEALVAYLSDDRILYQCFSRPEDFQLDFHRYAHKESSVFESLISISCYSLNYCYEEVLEWFKKLILSLSERNNLFAAYIDIHTSPNDSLIYEYCYDELLDYENKLFMLRSFSWGGYISKELFDKTSLEFKRLSKLLNVQELKNGIVFASKCKIENFNRSERKRTYNALKPALQISYGIIPVDHLLNSGFKPCDDEFCLFEDEESKDKYAVFSNGIALDRIKDELAERDYRYLKTIDLCNS